MEDVVPVFAADEFLSFVATPDFRLEYVLSGQFLTAFSGSL
jgi:hypothetical protein